MESIEGLELDQKDAIYKLALAVNSESVDAWEHDGIRMLASTISGLLDNRPDEEANRYVPVPQGPPESSEKPTLYNAPTLFLRPLSLRKMAEDADAVAKLIEEDGILPPYIEVLVAEQSTELLPDEALEGVHRGAGAPDGELYFPLPANQQQKEILSRLSSKYGARVQGPPGTGKSHTIANIICALLARGQRVLVTSQSGNPLKVIRGYLPEQIRSLCVSILGNDSEARGYLDEAVTAIGTHLGQRGSQELAGRVRRAEDELAKARSKVSMLTHALREWAELENRTVELDGSSVKAMAVAKYCAENRDQYKWFPDDLQFESELPLKHDELRELCALAIQLRAEDIRDLQCRRPTKVPSPADFEARLAQLDALETSRLTEQERQQLAALTTTDLNELEELQSFISDLSSRLGVLTEPWQRRILELSLTHEHQVNHWGTLQEEIQSLYATAADMFGRLSFTTVETGGLLLDQDMERTLGRLPRLLERGSSINKLVDQVRLAVDREAKVMLSRARVNGRPPGNADDLALVAAKLRYEKALRDALRTWEVAMTQLGGEPVSLPQYLPHTGLSALSSKLDSTLDYGASLSSAVDRLQSRGLCTEARQLLASDYIGSLQSVVNEAVDLALANKLREEFSTLSDSLLSEMQDPDAAESFKELVTALGNLDPKTYRQAHEENQRRQLLAAPARQFVEARSRLTAAAPLFSHQLLVAAASAGESALTPDWRAAWEWARLEGWLRELHNRQSVSELQADLERVRGQIRELTEELVVSRTWERQIAQISDASVGALSRWRDYMRKLGKGTGKQAAKWRASAREEMIAAQSAVPVWVVPINKVADSFSPVRDLFDVIVVDEASQCDMFALTVLFRGKKVLVVGDPEQISPSGVGEEMVKIEDYQRNYLSDFPTGGRSFDRKLSLDQLTDQIPGMDRVLLTEHFRCLPEIIQFNNMLCPTYGGKLEPLRQPDPAARLEPILSARLVEGGYRDERQKVNRPEAEAIVDHIVTMLHDEAYAVGGHGAGGSCFRTSGRGLGYDLSPLLGPFAEWELSKYS